MNKRIFVIILIVLGIPLVGCQTILGIANGAPEDAITADKEGVPKVVDYYPYLENTLLEYKGEGNEYAEQSVFFEFIDGKRAQMKIMNAGTNIIKILEYKDGILSEIYLEGEFYHIENMINVKPENESIILKEPLELGNLWLTKDGFEREITSLNANIETPYKAMEALEVTTTFEEGRFQKDYFTKGIGLVASIYTDGNSNVKTVLSSIKNKPLEKDVLVYYPLKENGISVFKDDKIVFYTNQNIEKLLEDKLKNPSSDKLIAPIPEGVVINSIHLDRSSWIVRVDFSEEILKNLNAGSAFEYEIIRSIVNTIGKYYDTEKVYISVAGIPYESGHYAIREGEYFKVDIEGINKFTKGSVK